MLMNSKKRNTERFRDNINYDLYCINIIGSGIKTIKDEFKKHVETGLRQPLFILDLDEVQQELNNQNLVIRKSLNSPLMNYIIQKIQRFREEYVSINQKINEELKFDLYEYWQKDANQKNKNKDMKPTKVVNGVKDIKKPNLELSCFSSLIAAVHNTAGQASKLSQRKYIKDEPTLGKLYIIIFGQMGVQFYMDLLRQDQPLVGIINFIPSESNYDIMLGNNKLRNFIEGTLNTINSTIYKMRQQVTMKSVGLFGHNLPIISNCLAAKYSREIYDQLSWSIYDIDVLKQQYDKYYYEPFQIMDVEIPNSVNLSELYYKMETGCVKGLFQNTVLPLSSADFASIACYLNNLLNMLESWDENRNKSFLISSNYKHHSVYNQNNLFSTITKINKQYNDCQQGRSIYLCCLDYIVFKKFLTYSPMSENQKICKGSKDKIDKKFILPKYLKFYANPDSCSLRLSELVQKYDKYQVKDLSPKCKLYTFKRFYCNLNIEEGFTVLPTRLCFRDFSLFQMEEFLQNLRLPKINTDSSTNNSIIESTGKILELNDNIFIRPNSLKALKLKKENSNIGNGEPTTRNSNFRKSQSKKNSLLAKTTIESGGLPPDHHLLKGYNLEDTLQEVKYKISKYNFPQGYIKLYEEKWCFKDMNKELTLALQNTKIYFNSTRPHFQGISNNIRFITDNNINVRILNESQECSKIVLNYPNGLSIFHHETYCEQIWYCDQTVGNEQRRIFTPFGAIIVYFKSNEFIMIMRYNGEVYKLYQHELILEEEEAQDIKTDSLDIQEKSSEYIDIKAQGDTVLLSNFTNKNKDFKKVKSRKKSELTFTISKQSIDKSINLSKSTSATTNLKALIDCELNFLNQMCSIYHLNYLHLVIITSQGKCLNLTPQGEIYEGRACFVKEWHDYYANELYSERSDGVRMVWNQNCFKCIHADGSLFKTTIEEDIDVAEDVDEFASQISQSSSHNNLKEELEEEGVRPILNELVKSSSSLNRSMYINNGVAEEYRAEHFPIIGYVSKSWQMKHPKYAIVYVTNTRNAKLPVALEIFGIDNIRLYYHTEPSKDLENFDFDYLKSEDEEGEKRNMELNLIANIWIGENLYVRSDKEACEIFAVLSRSAIEKEMESDSLTLRLKYTDDINDAFKYLLNEIASLENYNGKNKKELYFVEQNNSDGSIKGFEFINSLPQLSQYHHRVNNNITELKTIKTIQELMTNNDSEYMQDLNKFPQFKPQEKKNLCITEVTLPLILSANIFFEVPKQLRSATNITKFLEPMENINFKKLRGKFRNTLNYILKPQQMLDLQIFSSFKNWKKRQLEHERRLFNEQQRLGLYYAMNTYKTYPNFWKFNQTYRGQVRHLEFFDFMQNKCTKN
ncbi:male sterile (2) 34Fe [Cochliomyia hominivorax]